MKQPLSKEDVDKIVTGVLSIKSAMQRAALDTMKLSKSMSKTITGRHVTMAIIDDVINISRKDLEIIESIIKKISVNEKMVLRNKGMHPTKNRTNTLTNYFEDLTDLEQDLIVRFMLFSRPAFHIGLIPFLNRNFLLDFLHKLLPRKRDEHKWRPPKIEALNYGHNSVNVKEQIKISKQEMRRLIR